MQSQLRKKVVQQAEEPQGSSAEDELTCPNSHGWAVGILPMTHTGSCATDEGSRLFNSAEPPLLGEALSLPWKVMKKPPDWYQRCRSWKSSCELCPLPCQHPSWLQHLEASPSIWGKHKGTTGVSRSASPLLPVPDVQAHSCLP